MCVYLHCCKHNKYTCSQYEVRTMHSFQHNTCMLCCIDTIMCCNICMVLLPILDLSSWVMHNIISRYVINNNPCKGLVKKTATVSFVGQYITFSSLSFSRSVINKCVILMCLDFLPTDFIPFASCNMAL